MLKKFVAIKGVGLFENAGVSPALDRATLIYAENGRGKSTIAEILRACNENQSAMLAARQTLDSARSQEVELLIAGSAGNNQRINLAAGAWSSALPGVQVFDTDFINRNVYSGNEITANQRTSLLDFALDEQAVRLRQQLDTLTNEISTATQQATAAERVLSAHSDGMQTRDFVALVEDPQTDEKIDQLNRRIALSVNREALLRQASLMLVPTPRLNLGALFVILRETIDNVEQRAEQAVREHLARFHSPQLEGWISQGQDFSAEQQCPYCGQDIAGNNLIRAYQTHFNQHYADLKRKVSQLKPGIEQRLADAVIEGLLNGASGARMVAASWVTSLQFEEPVIELDESILRAHFAALMQQLMSLADRKSLQPLESVGTESELQDAESHWSAILQMVERCNDSMSAFNAKIDTFKEQLVAEDVQQLNRDLEFLRLRKKRHTAAVVADVQAYESAVAVKAQKIEQKEQQRTQLDALMAATLNSYEAEINRLLGIFGAQLQIQQFNVDYRGTGKPRSTYAIAIRGQQVAQTPGNGPHFGNTLSDGDKRSLAMAFFVARLKNDPQLAQKIIVIDDPMCSLDANRRAATLREVKILAEQCRQIIVLAHDGYFLRDLRGALTTGMSSIPTAVFAICRGANSYSDFGAVDLDELCASAYYKDHMLVARYIDNPHGLDLRAVAKAIRPMLEGFLHRRFPNLVPDKLLFGEIIQRIRQATQPNPLAYLLPHANELNDINAYAGQFHHNTNANADSVQINDGELLAYCNRAVAIIHKG